MNTVSFNVNGQSHRLDLDTRTTLLDALREHLHFTGTKKGCDQDAQCEREGRPQRNRRDITINEIIFQPTAPQI
ncbi:MAG: aldehyde dehydrogenase iron-sulfur subunit [Hyphomicrobiales bacterium]|nr:aldehyde dehydrogenase iron-sulfur subunit [Hyphomicrobiales bacterium]